MMLISSVLNHMLNPKGVYVFTTDLVLSAYMQPNHELLGLKKSQGAMLKKAPPTIYRTCYVI